MSTQEQFPTQLVIKTVDLIFRAKYGEEYLHTLHRRRVHSLFLGEEIHCSEELPILSPIQTHRLHEYSSMIVEFSRFYTDRNFNHADALRRVTSLTDGLDNS